MYENGKIYMGLADGARVELTYKEFELLRLFLSHPGMAFTRDQLMEKVWDVDYCGETRTVDMHIRTLRQKLGAYGEKIETVRTGFVRRAKLYYLRDRVGKAAKIREKL